MNKREKNKIAAFIIRKQAQINKMSGDEAEQNIRALNAFKAQFQPATFDSTHCGQ